MYIPSEDVAARDTMIVIGYLFVYDAKWQDVPFYLQKHLVQNFSNAENVTMDDFEPERIEERWATLQNTNHPIYEYWSNKNREDKKTSVITSRTAKEKVHMPATGMLREDGIHVDMDHLKKGEINLGTSIMAITFTDGVILGADSRTTTGAYIANRVTDKLTQVHDTIWCCRSGSAADTQAVADIVSYHLGMYGVQNGENPSTQTAAALFQELCYGNKDQLSAGMIIAGYTPKHGGSVYSIPLGGSLHKQSYAIGGSGSTYIYGYCDSYWKENMNEEEGIAFVKGALREAIKWDGSSGGVIRLVVLTNKGAVRHLYLPDQDYKGPGTG